MKLLCLGNFFLSLFLLPAQLNAARTAFYYGKDFPVSQVYFYERIVVQPENLTKDLLLEAPEKFFAYVSLGEKENLEKDLILGENKDWNSKIADIRKEKYQRALFDEIKKLREIGFKNFFLDTLDSYNLVLKEEKEKQAYEEAIVKFLAKIKETYPESEIMLNRGFEIMKAARPYASFLVAESLHFGIDTKEKTYKKISDSDSNWLKDKLNEAKSLGYEVSVIDYLPQDKREQRLALARKIKEEGFDPYVSDYNLETWGQSEYEKIPREILIFYDSKEVPDIVYSQAHRLASGPLEYYGYLPKLVDIWKPLPQDLSEVHGIIFLTESQEDFGSKKLSAWLSEAAAKGKKILFLQNFPFPWKQEYFSPFNLKLEENKASPGEKKKTIETFFKPFEAPFSFYHSEYLLTAQGCEPAVLFENSYGQKHAQAAICPWGGYAIDEAWIKQMDGKELFALDPYEFFKKALQLRDFPVLDVTTRNGRRALLAHIDGDGFSSLSRVSLGLYTGEVLKKEILEKYPIPHSVSLIRGEIERAESKEQEKLKKIALDIFSLPNVEIGNHSFSHPFKWIQLSGTDEYEHIEQVYNLNIPGYKLNINEEIIGTKLWLEKEFSQTGKKNNLFFWTGDCIAPLSALRLLKENAMSNINGGDTAITRAQPYRYLIAPLGLERNGYYQVYTGQQNENVYTNLWSGPFWGYSKAIETFELTEKPRRVKPINIYYHFYSAERKESLNALKKVYDYALSLKTSPVYASKYARSVEDFYQAGLYNYGDRWIVADKGELKTLRLSKDKYPLIKFSVAGYQKEEDKTYVNLYGKPPFEIQLADKPEKSPFLKNSSCEIEDFSLKENKIKFFLNCFYKSEIETENTKKCSYKREKIKKEGLTQENVYGECQ
jgi:hypothetical protein